MRTTTQAAAAGWFLCGLLVYADPYIRVNQVGYLPSHSKVAVALTNANLSAQTFYLERVSDGARVFSARVGADRGRHGSFAHVYELDFSAFAQQGQYRVAAASAVSHPFRLGTGIHRDAINKTLKFFKVQRCGNTQPLLHGACHLKKSVASGGPKNGQLIDVSGGWHDAGDYLKLLGQISATAAFLLLAHYERPAASADASGNGQPDVLDEAAVALDWMLKMWSPGTNTLYFQVSDPESDHNNWRMPEEDDSNQPVRKVYASKPGKGANLAGRMAAAFALGAVIWGQPQRRLLQSRACQCVPHGGCSTVHVGTPTWRSSTTDLQRLGAELERRYGAWRGGAPPRDWKRNVSSAGEGLRKHIAHRVELRFGRHERGCPLSDRAPRSFLQGNRSKEARTGTGLLCGELDC